MLSDIQLKDLAKKMSIPLEAVVFKDELLTLGKLKHNRSYIINMENELDEHGNPNEGSHWTCFQVNEYPNGKVEGVYFDSYGVQSPKIVTEFCGCDLPYSTIDIQSLMSGICGYYCLAYLHFINAYPDRTKDIFIDTDNFLSLFEDLNKSIDFKKNEYMLKHFFQSSDPELRKAIQVFDHDVEMQENISK
jgi:hypothetical protein